MTPNPFHCTECGQQANGLFKELNSTFKYIIKEESTEMSEIFIPIELQQQEGENDAN